MALHKTQNDSVRITVDGLVQGVGFRPFIHRLANQMGFRGSVWNSCAGVNIDLIGDDSNVQLFVKNMHDCAPEHARIDNVTFESISELPDSQSFSIQHSEVEWHADNVPPDRALCKRCREELTANQDRHQHYAFNSCADCGPRFSIIHAMPYARQQTAMAEFALCNNCQCEFDSHHDRRFHAEGISCGVCGPELQLLDANYQPIAAQVVKNILSCSGQLLADGKILALKGIGGFHLCCDALSEDVIQQLRQRKARPAKPFAIMLRDIQQVQEYFNLDALESEQLCSSAAPVVLLPKARTKQPLPEQLAPGMNCLGVMLAYSPLHFLLLNAFNKPLVMTSANARGEPLCTQNDLAKEALGTIADAWLVHNREIVNRCDDSIVKIINHVPRLLRRARGFVPDKIQCSLIANSHKTILAMGGDIKNSFALTSNDGVVLSGYNGDMAQPNCFAQTATEIADFGRLFNVSPDLVVVDKHPDYFSSQLGRKIATKNNLTVVEVQHHHAHLAACLVDNQVYPESPVLGIILDGSGYGDDGTLWGGELLLADFQQCQRVGGLKPFALLGGEKASQQPWRNALILLHQAGMLDVPSEDDSLMSKVVGYDGFQAQLLIKNQHMFAQTSSAGRLFDGVAALLGVAPAQQRFEGEAAMGLEALAMEADWVVDGVMLPRCVFSLTSNNSLLQLDPQPFLVALVDYLNKGVEKALLAAWFHQSFVDSWVALIKHTSKQSLYGGRQVVLSGGVFQNSLILTAMQEQLENSGYQVYSHKQVPSNDGGIALGQSVIALQQLESKSCV
ncbi:carbamoyltransferase HypF [Aliiglaciecola sp.]|nr:carbamoyltransferase HypF [Aliiglaciecola sp.]